MSLMIMVISTSLDLNTEHAYGCSNKKGGKNKVSSIHKSKGNIFNHLHMRKTNAVFET